MIQDKIALEICFELNNDPKNFKLTDTTDYASEGIALTDVEGLFKITAPDGTIAYENAGFATNDFTSPDVDVDVSTLFDTVSLPLDSKDEVQLGDYVLEYKIEVIGGVQPGVYTKSFSVQNCHVDPIVDVDFETDCFNSKLTSTDNTNYSTELVPSPTSIVRTHTAYPPPTSGLSDTVTPNKILVASPISTKTWTLEVSSVVRWDYPDGLCIINTLEGDIEAEVTCDISICDIFCCIDKLYKRYEAKLGINSVLASQIKNQLDIVALDLVLFENALKCGHNDKAQVYYDHILAVSGCEPGCSCTDVDAVQVIPVCVVTGTAVVDACGNGAITVTPNTVGSTTTYTVCFEQTLLDKLNASFNTTLTAGTDIVITPTVAPNGDIDYVVNSTGGGLFKEVRVPISSAEILDLHNTPKELLPAVTGTIYEVESVVLIYNKVTTDYTLTGFTDEGLRIHYTGPGGFNEWKLTAPEDSLGALNALVALGYTAWANRMYFNTVDIPNIIYSVSDNMNVELRADPAGTFTLGDHTITAVVTYRDITI